MPKKEKRLTGFIFMRRQLNKKALLKIVAATSVTIFSLLSVCTGVFAWFATVRERKQTSDDFVVTRIESTVSSICIYQYLGESEVEGGTTYFGFNPTPYGVLDVEGSDVNVSSGSPVINLDQYSIDDPHHPCLLIFETSERSTRVVADTLKPFLAKAKPGADNLASSNIVAFQSLLEGKKSGASDGEIFEVTNDETQEAEYEEVINEVIVRKKIKTRYAYNATTDDFDLVWMDLAMYDNPLSSAVIFNWVTFNGLPTATNKNLFLYESDGFGGKIRKEESESTSCIAIDRKDLDENDESAFVTFTGAVPSYDPTTIIFDGGDIDNEVEFTHVGIVVDYNQLALEYLFSCYIGHPYLSGGISFKCDWKTYL